MFDKRQMIKLWYEQNPCVFRRIIFDDGTCGCNIRKLTRDEGIFYTSFKTCYGCRIDTQTKEGLNKHMESEGR